MFYQRTFLLNTCSSISCTHRGGRNSRCQVPSPNPLVNFPSRLQRHNSNWCTLRLWNLSFFT
ncbi:hypothetical protein X975_02954, partial [Stegodyphus mimosarum]